jgi:hypothetical protein
VSLYSGGQLSERFIELAKGESRAKKQYSGEPLSPGECARIREIIDADDFSRKLWSMVRVVAAWAMGVLVVLASLSETIGKLFRGIFGK